MLLFTVQEDGLKNAVEAFHRHLPLEKMTIEEKVHWHVAKPHFVNVFSEVGRGFVGVFAEPVRGYREGGESCCFFSLILVFIIALCSCHHSCNAWCRAGFVSVRRQGKRETLFKHSSPSSLTEGECGRNAVHFKLFGTSC